MRTSYRLRYDNVNRFRSTDYGSFHPMPRNAMSKRSNALWVELCRLLGLPDSASVDRVHALLRDRAGSPADRALGRGTVQRIGSDGRVSALSMQKLVAILGDRQTTRLIQINSGIATEPAAGITDRQPDAHASVWPFDNVDFTRWDRLTERQKGIVEDAMNSALDRIESTNLQRANGARQ